MVPHSGEDDAEVDPEPWDEPETLEKLVDAYVLEAKMAGKVAGTSLYVVPAKARDGTMKGTVDGQQYKLFLVIWLEIRGTIR